MLFNETVSEPIFFVPGTSGGFACGAPVAWKTPMPSRSAHPVSVVVAVSVLIFAIAGVP